MRRILDYQVLSEARRIALFTAAVVSRLAKSDGWRWHPVNAGSIGHYGHAGGRIELADRQAYRDVPMTSLPSGGADKSGLYNAVLRTLGRSLSGDAVEPPRFDGGLQPDIHATSLCDPHRGFSSEKF